MRAEMGKTIPDAPMAPVVHVFGTSTPYGMTFSLHCEGVADGTTEQHALALVKKTMSFLTSGRTLNVRTAPEVNVEQNFETARREFKAYARFFIVDEVA